MFETSIKRGKQLIKELMKWVSAGRLDGKGRKSEWKISWPEEHSYYLNYYCATLFDRKTVSTYRYLDNIVPSNTHFLQAPW